MHQSPCPRPCWCSSHSLPTASSGSLSAVLLFLIAYVALLNYRRWVRYASVGAVVAVIAILNPVETARTAYTLGVPGIATMEVAPDIAGDGASTVSRSVSLRENILRQSLGVLSSGPLDALFGSFQTTRYVPMDGQFFVFLFNGGLVTLLALAVPSAFVFLTTLISVWRRPGDIHLMALHLIIAAFGITFLASRVLMYFPFNFLFFLACGLAMARLADASAPEPTPSKVASADQNADGIASKASHDDDRKRVRSPTSMYTDIMTTPIVVSLEVSGPLPVAAAQLINAAARSDSD